MRCACSGKVGQCLMLEAHCGPVSLSQPSNDSIPCKSLPAKIFREILIS